MASSSEAPRQKEQMQITPEQALPTLTRLVGNLETPLDAGQIVSVTHNPKSRIVAVETHFYFHQSRGTHSRPTDELCTALQRLGYYCHAKHTTGGTNLLFMIPETEFMQDQTAEAATAKPAEATSNPPEDMLLTTEEKEKAEALARHLQVFKKRHDLKPYIQIIPAALAGWISAVENALTDPNGYALRKKHPADESQVSKYDPTSRIQQAIDQLNRMTQDGDTIDCLTELEEAKAFVSKIKTKLAQYTLWLLGDEGAAWRQTMATRTQARETIEIPHEKPAES